MNESYAYIPSVTCITIKSTINIFKLKITKLKQSKSNFVPGTTTKCLAMNWTHWLKQLSQLKESTGKGSFINDVTQTGKRNTAKNETK